MASEDDVTDAQIKKLYAVLHSVGIDPKEFKKNHNIASYAKLKRGECSAYIEQLEEQENKEKGEYKAESSAKVTDGDSKETDKPKAQAEEKKKAGLAFTPEQEEEIDFLHAETEVSKMAQVMRLCVRHSAAIVEQEINGGGLSEASRAQMQQKLATSLFIEAMRRGL